MQFLGLATPFNNQQSAMGESSPGTPPSVRPPEDRLDSWKEIAAHLNRDVTTVQRGRSGRGCPFTDTCTIGWVRSTPLGRNSTRGRAVEIFGQSRGTRTMAFRTLRKSNADCKEGDGDGS